MSRSTIRNILITLVIGALIALVYLAAVDTAQAYEGVSVKHARTHVRSAKAALAEAERVLTATRRYSAAYGASVGRWVWLADDVKWPAVQWPTLFMVIDRESGGSPGIMNSQGSGAAGLLQFMAPAYQGQWGYPAFPPLNPRASLKAGVWFWRHSGWQPWAP